MFSIIKPAQLTPNHLPPLSSPGLTHHAQAKAKIQQTQGLNHEYLPIRGSDPFLALAKDLILGEPLSSNSNVISFQTISGTGANHLGAQFLAQQLKPKHVFISNPTWSNHHLVWTIAAPDVIQKTYPYWDQSKRGLDFSGWMKTLEIEAVENDVVVLHACAHNPTGIDPTPSQWTTLAQLFKRKKLVPFFDSAYQGFASGDLDADAWAVRHFQKVLMEDPSPAEDIKPQCLCIAQSFAKNFGLYGERVGAFHLSLPPLISSTGANSQIVRLIRAEISNPPLFGARIVFTILSNPSLKAEWILDLQKMSSRLTGVRSLLRQKLEQQQQKEMEKKRPQNGDWSHLTSQIGMFSYTGLTESQVLRLKVVHHVYLMRNGRASLSGVNEGNVGYIAEAFGEVLGL